MKIPQGLKKLKKSMMIVSAICILFIFLSFLIQSSRNLSDKNTKALKQELAALIETLRSNSYQLANIINETEIDLTYHNLYQFYPTDIEKKSQELVIQLNKDSDNPFINKRRHFRDSVIFIRQSLSHYKMALQQISEKKYKEAKYLLKAADYYLSKAEMAIPLKTAEREVKTGIFKI